MTTANSLDFYRQLTSTTRTTLSDRELVVRILTDAEGAGFDAIVARHGPMVYRVCWRVLGHAQDVEDAFQATFLVLAQKLHTLRNHASLASWLHGVACRTALKAKARSFTQRRHENLAAQPEAVPPDDITWKELRAVLDVELSQLPDKWREPLVLCYLEGQTQDEAAHELGWSKSTLRRRLQDARSALGVRLTRRGIVWPAAVSAVLVADCVSVAGLPLSLVEVTCRAAIGVVTGKGVATVATSQVTSLAEGVLKTMIVSKWKLATMVVAFFGLVLTGIGGVTSTNAVQEPPKPPAKGAEKPTPKKADPERDEPPRANKRIEKLIEQRLTILKRLADLAQERYKLGNGSFEDVHRAIERLTRAELEAASTLKERLAIHTKLVVLLQKQEMLVQQRVENGSASAAELLQVNAARLEAEIAMERDKAKLATSK